MFDMIDRKRLLLEMESDENKSADTMQFERYSEMVRRQPAIDVVPVVHGHWKHRDDDTAWKNECSVCKALFYFETPYCYLCGSKMDENEGEQDENYIG